MPANYFARYAGSPLWAMLRLPWADVRFGIRMPEHAGEEEYREAFGVVLAATGTSPSTVTEYVVSGPIRVDWRFAENVEKCLDVVREYCGTNRGEPLFWLAGLPFVDCVTVTFDPRDPSRILDAIEAEVG